MPSIVDKSSVKMVCVDDFALRKRFSYGTVMINLENHRIVDMIPSRDTNVVCNWLKTFHNIEVISRDLLNLARMKAPVIQLLQASKK